MISPLLHNGPMYMMVKRIGAKKIPQEYLQIGGSFQCGKTDRQRMIVAADQGMVSTRSLTLLIDDL